METPPLRRRRPAVSCIPCRRRKLKCDRDDPCSRCIAAGAPCTYRASRKGPSARIESRQDSPRPLPSVRLKSPPLAQLSSLGGAAGALSLSEPSLPWTAAAAAATVTTKQHDPSDLLGHGHVQSTSPSNDEARGLTDLPHHVQNLDRLDTTTAISDTPRGDRHLEARQSGSQSSQIVLNKNRMLRWSHWIGTAKEFKTVVECYTKYVTATVPSDEAFQNPEARTLAAQIGRLIQDCKIEARRAKVGRPTRSLPSYQFDLKTPPRALADSMVDRYFASFESTHRILHVPSFRVEYESYWNQADRVSTGVLLRILLTIAIGSSLDERAVADLSFRSTVHDWVCAAQVWLSGPLEKDRLNISGLQIHCLTLLAREIFSIGGDLIWISTASLMHQAMQMGLHRDPKHFSDMSILQAEIRRRLWATILEMVVQSSLDSALPARISLDEFDTEAPSNINDHEIDRSSTAIQPHSRDIVTSMSVQLLLFDSLPTRLRILRLLNDLRTEIAYSDVLILDSEINEAVRTCNRLGMDVDGCHVSQFHRNLLDYLVRRFLIPLHCPFASQARMNRIFSYSLEASLNASLALVTVEPDESFTRLMTLGGGLLREGIRCASSVISLELLAKVETQRLDGTLQRGSWQREALKRAMYDMIASSSMRIRLGETNIKPHMFLNMIMAQVEAIEKGLPCEVEIAKSAKESLTFCYALISRRADGVSSLGSAGHGLTPSTIDNEQDILGLDLDLDTNISLDFFLPNDTFY